MNKFIRFSSRAAGIAAAVAITSATYAAPADSFLGEQGDAQLYDRVITITPVTKWVNVNRDESVKFVVASNGQSFVWHFDTPKMDIPLEAVAPAGTLNGQHIEAFVTDTSNND